MNCSNLLRSENELHMDLLSWLVLSTLEMKAESDYETLYIFTDCLTVAVAGCNVTVRDVVPSKLVDSTPVPVYPLCK